LDFSYHKRVVFAAYIFNSTSLAGQWAKSDKSYAVIGRYSMESLFICYKGWSESSLNVIYICQRSSEINR